MTPPASQGGRDRAQGEAGEGRGPSDPGAVAGRVGLYFCHCGPNLGTLVRLGQLEEPRAWSGVADVDAQPILCSEEGRAWLARRIRERGVERVVVAACSPREHQHTFEAVLAAEGRSPFFLQMVNLREQVEWVGGSAEAATLRARRLVGAALRRVALHRAFTPEEVEVTADVLVVGGGAAGVSAALALARRDRKVVLVEREFVVGGLANRLDLIFPDLECASCFMEPALDALLHSERVEVLTGAEVRRVRGTGGRFEVELALRPRGVDPAACLGCNACGEACPAPAADPFAAGLASRKAIGLPYVGCLPHASVLDAGACVRARGEACDLCARACPFGAVRLDDPPRARAVEVGAIVIATGLRPGEVEGPEGVLSTHALERMLHLDGPTRGVLRGRGGREPRTVLLATTAADADGGLAIDELLKLAHVLRSRLPRARIVVAGGLEGAPGLAPRVAALSAEGIEFLRGAVSADGIAAAGEALAVAVAGAPGTVEADLVALHPPSRPPAGAGELSRLLRIERTASGFLADRGAGPFEPTATRVPGVYVAGAAAGPRPIAQAIRDGKAAAGLVLASLVAGERRLVEPLAAEIDEGLCGGCGICRSACPFGAITVRGGEAPRAGAMRVEAIHCRGCGSCVAACPTGAAAARHFTREQISAEITALLRSPGPAPGALGAGAGG